VLVLAVVVEAPPAAVVAAVAEEPIAWRQLLGVVVAAAAAGVAFLVADVTGPLVADAATVVAGQLAVVVAEAVPPVNRYVRSIYAQSIHGSFRQLSVSYQLSFLLLLFRFTLENGSHTGPGHGWWWYRSCRRYSRRDWLWFLRRFLFFHFPIFL
jgi:drug/metabolite transporter (DMT)-like permease